MAKFGEEVNFNCVNVKRSFRLPIAVPEQNVYLINEGRNSIVKVNDRKLQHSWTLSHPHSFTSPVSFNNDDSSVYCVIDDEVLMTWSVEDDNLNNASKLKFPETIFTVVHIPDQSPIIIFSSGKFAIVNSLTGDDGLVPLGETLFDTTDSVVWADATKVNSDIIVVFLELSKQNNKYQLHYFSISEGIASKYHSHLLDHDGCVLKNWCLHKHIHSFISIWSDGSVLNYSLTEKTQLHLLKITDIGKKSLQAIDYIDTNHLIVLKYISKNQEFCLEMWDFKFNALKAKKTFKVTSPSYVQMFATASAILLSYNEELIEIPCDIEKSTLAAAIGKSVMKSDKIRQSSWSNGKLTHLSAKQNSVEKMDITETNEKLCSAEIIAQRLMDEGPNYLSHITESQLVKLLSLTVSHKHNRENNTSFDPDTILNIIFSASFSNLFLIKFMKRMKLEDSMITLEILLDYLKVRPSSEGSQKIPTDIQIFSWISVVMQSHMEELLLSRERSRIKFLNKLDSCIKEKMEEYEDCESIQSLLTVIKMKNLPPVSQIGLYSVETLNL